VSTSHANPAAVHLSPQIEGHGPYGSAQSSSRRATSSILARDEPYAEVGADWPARRDDAAHTRRLVAQLERLGHTVVLDSMSCPPSCQP